MKIGYGAGNTEYGPGVSIELSGDEVATAIDAYLVARGVCVRGPRTVKVNGDLCSTGRIYVDPAGSVVVKGIRYSGRGPEVQSRFDLTLAAYLRE